MSDLFSISPETLEQLFNPDNIRTGKSLNMLETFSGISGLSQKLITSVNKGISKNHSDLANRELHFGKNHFHVQNPRTILQVMLEIMQDMVVLSSTLATVASIVIGAIQDPASGWLEGLEQLFAILILVAISAAIDSIKSSRLDELKLESDLNKVVVIRSGEEVEIQASDLLVGDIMLVNPGEKLTVDGILIKGGPLSVDESCITGESILVKKQVVQPGDNSAIPFLVSGERLCDGKGIVLVCAVGAHSFYGKLKSSLDEEELESPLEEYLNKVAEKVGKIGLCTGLMLTIVLLACLIYRGTTNKTWGLSQWSQVIDSVIFGLTLLAIAVPEGIPLTLTSIISFSFSRMKKDQILLRKLKGLETMGTVTNILTKKTGILTQNRMILKKICLFDQEFENPTEAHIPQVVKEALAESISRNTTSHYKVKNQSIEVIGDITEGALLQLLQSWGFDYHTIRNTEFEKIQYPFDLKCRTMTTVYGIDNEVRVYSKGDGKRILKKCNSFMNASGQVSTLTDSERSIIKQKMKEDSRNLLRIMGLAMKTGDSNDSIASFGQEEIEKNLTFLGFVAFENPLKLEARTSVIKAQQAGVNVRMITGDSFQTALAVARRLNIISQDIPDDEAEQYVIKGKRLRELVGGILRMKSRGKSSNLSLFNMNKFKEIIGKIKVVAKCSPDDKLIMVIGLKSIGEIVGVVSNSQTDEAVLKESNVGLALMSSHQSVNDSSDITLLDDNFEGILNSIRWGRNVFLSIQKFIQFQLTVIAVTLALSIIGVFTGIGSPLSIIQLLWVILITDSLAILALGTDSPSAGILNYKPFVLSDNIITPDMHFNIKTQTIFQIVTLVLILFAGPTLFQIQSSWDNQEWTQENGKHSTIYFHTFVMLQLFNEINCRHVDLTKRNIFQGILSNKMFVNILLATFVVQIVFIEFGGRILKCSNLSLGEHLTCIGIGALGNVISLIARTYFSARKQELEARGKKNEDIQDPNASN